MANFTYENKKGFNGFGLIRHDECEYVLLKMCKEENNFEVKDRDTFFQCLEEDLYNVDMFLLYSSYDGYWYIYDSQYRWFGFPHIYSMSLEMENETIPSLLDGDSIKLYRVDKDIEKELNEYHEYR